MMVTTCFQHPEWRGVGGMEHDIAVLRLARQVFVPDPRLPIAFLCVPSNEEFEVYDDDECWLTGWGKVQGKCLKNGNRFDKVQHLLWK